MGSCRIPKLLSDLLPRLRAEVVELFVYVERLRTHFETVAQAHDSRLSRLVVLPTLNEPLPIWAPSPILCCDPSNVTGVVARLQERGLLIPPQAPKDRCINTCDSPPKDFVSAQHSERTLFPGTCRA